MRGGRPVAARLTDRDLEILKLLSRYRYLPSDYIHAFVGGSHKALTRRLNVLSRRPNLYLTRPPQQRHTANANQRPLVYGLDEAGTRPLRDLGLLSPAKTLYRNFLHELMVAEITASIELGAKDNHHVRLIPWSEILKNPNTPQATREARSPSIPVAYSWRGERHTVNLTADARPFGLERHIAGNRTYLFFPGIEADCGTEPIEPSDSERSSIVNKIVAYTAIAEQGIYRSHFGFPNFFVPIIANNESRTQSIIRLLDKLTDGHGSKLFLFKTFSPFAGFQNRNKAPGHMLTEPWLRAGHPPLSLIS